MELYPKDQKAISEIMFELGARERLAAIASSTEYRDMKLLPPPEKGQPRHVYLLNRAISGVRKQAYEQYASVNPEFKARRDEWQAAKDASEGSTNPSDILRKVEKLVNDR